MTCENCDADGEAVYTLSAQIADTDMTIDMPFCSTSCLREWLATDSEDGERDGTTEAPAASATPSWVGKHKSD